MKSTATTLRLATVTILAMNHKTNHLIQTKTAKAKKKKMIMGKTQQIRTAKKSMLQAMIILSPKLMLLGQMLKTIY
jgi:hypothetical protein